MQQNKALARQAGNVFIIILVGIALFAGLSLVVSRSMQTETASKMTEREMVIVASEALTYAANMKRAVDRVRRKGCSENDISFSNSFVSGYEHAPVVDDKCKVFHPDGGGATWVSPTAVMNDGSDWLFVGRGNVIGVGANSSCSSGATHCADLLMILPMVNYNLCLELNRRFDITTSDDEPSQQNDGISTLQFVGDYARHESIEDSSDEDVLDLQRPVYAMCSEYSSGGTYFFYYTLLAR